MPISTRWRRSSVARDALDRLARLRVIEERGAKLELARRLASQAAAEREAQQAAAAIVAEAAGDADAFARWLPRAIAARERSAIKARVMAGQSDEARGALALAHQARTVVDEALAARQAEADREADRHAQNAIDDLVQRPRAGR
jgi:hypothetical protein